jgi:hypothetical protein
MEEYKMKKLLAKIARLFNPVYSLVYTDAKGITQMYTISKPRHKNEFGNKKQGLAVAGFRAHCYNRQGIRSFRYDRVVSLVKG